MYSNRILIESFRKEVDEEPRSRWGLSDWVLSAKPPDEIRDGGPPLTNAKVRNVFSLSQWGTMGVSGFVFLDAEVLCQ